MEDMDIDSVVDIPDTPDRLFSQRMKGGDSVNEERNFAGHVVGSNSAGKGSLDRSRGNSMLFGEKGNHRKLYTHSRKLSGSVDEIECQNDTIVLSPLEKAREKAPLFRKAAMGNGWNSVGDRYMDKGKAPKFPSRSSGVQEDHAIFDLSEQNMHNQTPEIALPQVGSKNHLVERRREGQILRNGGSYLCNSSSNSAITRNNCKGKEKIDDTGVKGLASVIDNGKGVGLSRNSPLRLDKQYHATHHSIASPRASGRKRLVRNGCISPQNIAIRAKQLNEKSENSFKAEQNAGNVVSNSPDMIDISKIVAEDSNNVKGKGVVRPHTSEEHNNNFINLSDSPLCNSGEASGINNLNRDGCFEEKGGWRSTRNCSNNVDYTARCHSSRVTQQNENRVVNRDVASGGNNRILCDTPETETGPVIFSEFNQRNEPSHANNMLSKRQTKHVLTSRNSRDSTRVIPNDSDIVFLGSSRESSSSSSSRIHAGRHLDVLDIDDSSEVRGTAVNYNEPLNDEDSEARARQVEADEILARELQEQLYHEVPIFGNGEIDESIAWTLQQEEDVFPPASLQSLYEPHQRGSTRQSRIQSSLGTSQTTSNRRGAQARIPSSDTSLRTSQTTLHRRGAQARIPSSDTSLRTSQVTSNRRGAQARVPSSARVSRLRSQVMNQPRATPSRTRNFQFPLDMDLDMRLDILEAMEAAIGDVDDMGMTFPFFQVQRDFNENDYEMLLALDDNNHQHGGASVHQINSLPLSKVQSDNFEESCAICLETPAVGETIRHLPCLHKFHKDCIDPWLCRKTSCPVCKSSIT